MPEGPSIVLLCEQAAPLAGQTVQRASGIADLDFARLQRRKLLGFRSWGKHFLIQFQRFSLRVHFGLFGSFAVGKAREGRKPRLSLVFKDGALHLYACTIRILEGPLESHYDWSADVLSPQWDPAAAREKLRKHPQQLVCDALLDQDVFAGVGNIIKNEVLFRIRVHPESTVGALPARKLAALIEEARSYSFEFLEWKRAGELRQHWLAHTRSSCPRCHIPLHCKILGQTRRRSFFCSRCQLLHRQPVAAAVLAAPARKLAHVAPSARRRKAASAASGR